VAHAPKPSADNALTNLTDQDRFQQLQRVAKMMGASALTPAHLRGGLALLVAHVLACLGKRAARSAGGH
jgi:nitric oxide synthase oxygenase domain/subunit